MGSSGYERANNELLSEDQDVSLYQRQLQQQQYQQQLPQLPEKPVCRLNKLICSFKSDLPNEIDFAMQVATLLANSDNFTWYKDYPLVDAICSSLHVFVCVCGDISNCYCYPRFWHKLLIKNANNHHLQSATLPPDMKLSFLKFEALKDHDLKDQTKIYKRIKTAAELTKQFSMTTDTSKNEKNDQNNYDYLHIKKKKLKASPSLLKFVSLLLHCDDTPLNLIGLDILSNTASKLAKVPDAADDPTCAKLVQMFQDYCFDSICRQDGDIYIVNRSIEVISRLISSSSRRVSSNVTNQMTERNLVYRIEQFLTSHYDVTLFLSALECCYRISRHQPHLLSSDRCRYLMKILVNLLNCDDNRYFTPTALKRIKLIDEFDSQAIPLAITTNTQHQPLTKMQQPPMKPQQIQSAPKPLLPTQLQPNLIQRQPVALPTKVIIQPNQTSTPTNQNPSQTNQTSQQNNVAHQPSNQISQQPSQVPQQPNQVSQQPSQAPQQPNQVSQQTSQALQQSNQVQQQPNQVAQQPNQAPKQSGLVQQQPDQVPQQPTQVQQVPQQPNQVPKQTQFIQQASNGHSLANAYTCEWNYCSLKFNLPKELYAHVFEAHIGPLPSDTLSSCVWSGPNGTGPGCLTKRPKFSLLTHLNDFHCSQNPSAQPVKPPEHPGYAPNAALLAIKRHANAHIGLKSNLQNQSPLSISVRLTAALILRNLATESAEVKQALENYEPLLCEICMTNGRDESKIIAECLNLFCNE